MRGSIICPKCQGNGFRKIFKDESETQKIEIDCAYCNSEGEVDITEEVMTDLLASRRNQ